MRRRASVRPTAPTDYDWGQSTRENYVTTTPGVHTAPFASTRQAMDDEWHGPGYTLERQAVQDAIVKAVLNETEEAPREADARPWIILSGGVMGVGKTRSLRWLSSMGIADLSNTVLTDADRIKWRLPEIADYVRRDADSAATRTHAESAYIVEIIRQEAILSGRSVVIDGSMRHAEWWAQWIARQRSTGGAQGYRFALWHFVAPPSKIYERAARRSVQTGRHVPREVIEKALVDVPHSVERLLPLMDVTATISTADDRCPRLVELRADDSVLQEERAAAAAIEHAESHRRPPPTLSGNQREWKPFAELFGARDGFDRSQRRRRRGGGGGLGGGGLGGGGLSGGGLSGGGLNPGAVGAGGGGLNVVPPEARPAAQTTYEIAARAGGRIAAMAATVAGRSRRLARIAFFG